jgi:hypothetical protein
MTAAIRFATRTTLRTLSTGVAIGLATVPAAKGMGWIYRNTIGRLIARFSKKEETGAAEA